MILDHLSNADSYRNLGPRFVAAFDYLKNTDFAATAVGRYDIDGDSVYAMVQTYETKPMTGDVIWESHRKYIDVQYVAQGAEWLGYRHLTDDLTVTTPYSDENDCQLYDTKGNLMDLTQGMFAILAPDDVHAPCLAAGTPSQVLKVVIKVAVDPTAGPCGF